MSLSRKRVTSKCSQETGNQRRLIYVNVALTYSGRCTTLAWLFLD